MTSSAALGPPTSTLLHALALAGAYAHSASADPRTKTATVLADRSGSTLLRAVNAPVAESLLRADLSGRLEAPEKYFWIEHSERAALQRAARTGLATEGLWMGCTLFPCVDCARAIVGSGIALLLTARPDFDYPRWGPEFRRSLETLEAGHVELILLDPAEIAEAISRAACGSN